MAIARQTTAASVRPLDGALVRRYVPGAAIAVGEIVSMSADGYIDPANTTSADACVVGIALEAATGAGAPGKIDVVVWGPVTAITGGTPGKTLFASDTAGEPAETAGTNEGITGFVESATVAFVRPTHAAS